MRPSCCGWKKRIMDYVVSAKLPLFIRGDSFYRRREVWESSTYADPSARLLLSLRAPAPSPQTLVSPLYRLLDLLWISRCRFFFPSFFTSTNVVLGHHQLKNATILLWYHRPHLEFIHLRQISYISYIHCLWIGSWSTHNCRLNSEVLLSNYGSNKTSTPSPRIPYAFYSLWLIFAERMSSRHR